MLIKICGITTREDAVAAVLAGASALGFNFYKQSPRYVSPQQAREIAEDLPVTKVGVFVDEPAEVIRNVSAIAKLDVAQLHGNESPEFLAGEMRTWKAMRVGSGWAPEMLEPYNVEAFVLDGPVPGSGQVFDWTLARGIKQRIILAGGLGPENVAAAVRELQPFGVDACSRLESAPGLKDHQKMRQFVKAALSESKP